jgi:hypothetical protein
LGFRGLGEFDEKDAFMFHVEQRKVAGGVLGFGGRVKSARVGNKWTKKTPDVSRGTF